MSVSDIDNNLKLWDANNWECILNLENVNKQGFLNSAYFLNDKNNIYIISSNWNFKNSEKIKVFNIKGEKIKEINDSDDKAVFITSFYDIKKLKYYIITGNDGYIRSYDYNENKAYNKYEKNKIVNSYYCLIIKYFGNILYIISSNFDGYIRIWDFHSNEIIFTIYGGNKGLIGICFWDDTYIFSGASDQLLRVINLKKRKINKEFSGLKDILCTVQKINHPIYGECLITQGLLNDQIKLWTFKNN